MAHTNQPTKPSSNMVATRDIFLIIYHSPLFPAHWSIWVPSADAPKVGKIVHVTGDAANGFEHAFKRSCSLTTEERNYSIVLLDKIDSKHVVDVPGDGAESVDTNAADDIEQVALTIPAPGKSLISAANATQKKKVEIKNCQTWLRQLVEALVKNGIFHDAAMTALEKAPRN